MNSVSPVSFRARVATLPKKGMPVGIDANEEQRGALAREHGLLSVQRFHADLLVEPWKRDGVRVLGKVEAEIEQACTVTLEPLAAEIVEEVEAFYLPEGSRLSRPRLTDEGEILLDPEGADSPETFSGDEIDVGALAEEFFALAIDPYPRKEGANLDQPQQDRDDASPFAKLRVLKQQN